MRVYWYSWSVCPQTAEVCGASWLWGKNEQQEAYSRVGDSYFFLSSNHNLIVVRFSTVQSYSVHKTRCFPSFCVRRTSRAGLCTCIVSAWGCWRSYLPSCWHNNFLGRLNQVELVFLHHFSDRWTTLFSHLWSKQGGFRHSILIVWAEVKRQSISECNCGLFWGGEAFMLGEVETGMSLKAGIRGKAKMVKRDLRFPV